MCNETKCTIQYTVDLIHNIKQGCARRMCKQVVPGMYPVQPVNVTIKSCKCKCYETEFEFRSLMA